MSSNPIDIPANKYEEMDQNSPSIRMRNIRAGDLESSESKRKLGIHQEPPYRRFLGAKPADKNVLGRRFGEGR